MWDKPEMKGYNYGCIHTPCPAYPYKVLLVLRLIYAPSEYSSNQMDLESG